MDRHSVSHKINISWYNLSTNKNNFPISTFWPGRNMIIDEKDCYSFDELHKCTECYKSMEELANSVDENIMTYIKNQYTYVNFTTTNTQLVEKVKTLCINNRRNDNAQFGYCDTNLK
jgi:hypothetical protein